MATVKKSTNKAPKKTGVNKGIEKGVAEEQFTDKVICKKCGKEIGFTLGSELFLKCPRCGARVERDIKAEEKKAKKIIKEDVLRRSKKAQLSVGFGLTLIALAYNIVGFFSGWFADAWVTNGWWFELFSVPLVLFSFFLIKDTKETSASAKYRFFARLALIINFVAMLVIAATTVPYLADKIHEFLGK